MKIGEHISKDELGMEMLMMRERNCGVVRDYSKLTSDCEELGTGEGVRTGGELIVTILGNQYARR